MSVYFSALKNLHIQEGASIFAASISTSRKQKPIITRKGGENRFETWASIARIYLLSG